MSDWIFEEEYLQMANNAERHGKTIQEWKDWHREISGILGCNFVERQITLKRAKEVMARLREFETGSP